MLALRDIMNATVVTVDPDAPLGVVAQLLATEGISGVPVVTASRVLGVVSARDIMDFSASDHGERGEDGRGSVWSAYDADGDAAQVGTASLHDGWPDRPASDGEDADDESDAYGEFTAGDIMTRPVFALAPDTPIDEAGRYMLQRGIHRVLVVDNGNLAGIVTSMDFVKVIAHGLLGNSTA